MIVNGVDIPESTLTGALSSLGPAPFGVRELSTTLEAAGVDPAISYDAAKRLLQRERKAGRLVHDQTNGLWTVATSAATPGTAAEPAPTLPLHPGPVETAAAPDPAPVENVEASPELPGQLREALAYTACLAAVGALALINASFAWEIAETQGFRIAFVSGMMASDLMRPLLVAQGLFELAQDRLRRGMLAIAVAFLLAPVSVFSSTAVISAALHLGAEEIEQDAVEGTARAALQSEYERLKARAEQAWAAWERECSRGGCGALAAEHEATAKALEAETRTRLDALLAASGPASQGASSSFLSRTVKAYQDLGLFGGGMEAALPLMLALTLEIAALFGPALLLAGRRPPAP